MKKQWYAKVLAVLAAVLIVLAGTAAPAEENAVLQIVNGAPQPILKYSDPRDTVEPGQRYPALLRVCGNGL